MNNPQILVLDFGSQYTQLIARRLREYGVYTEIVPYFESIESVRAKNPKGIILSGGPASVYEEGAYKPDDAIFTLGIPILGICYGLHLVAHHFGGKVIKADAQEFGKAILEILEPQSRSVSDTRTILATPRTILREYTQKDFEALCAILGDSQTMYAWGQGFEAQETQEWLDEQIKSYQQNGFGIWAIVDKKSGEVIGNTGLNYKTIYAGKIAQEQPQKVIEIGYLLRHDFWGKGYATECVNACLEYAFSVPGLKKVYCFVKEDNLASIKVAQRLGMRKVDECIKAYKGKELPHLIFESQRVSYDLLGKAMFPHVVKLWEGSVRSSHHFLNEQDILSIQREVKKALKSTQHVIVARQKKTFLGFIGIEKNRIEMLFVSPLVFRQGIGKALIKEALNRFLNSYQIIKVDCNEQNPQALGFYQRLGFEIIGKSPTDSAGRDFPIVHLEVRTDKLSSTLKNTFHYAVIPACKQDLQTILALQHTAFIDEAKRVGKMNIEPLTQDIESIKREFKQKLFLKCVQNGKIIGSVRGYKENDTTYIGKLFVDSAYRKKGIGSALVETLCAMLPAKRYEIFTSEKSFENIALYQKLGFAEYKRESMRDIPVKAVFMEKVAADSSLACKSPLFKDVKQDSIVWMSHADKVESIPQGFIELAKSGNTPYCAIADLKRKVYALQFHPEVVHSECGGQILRNFAVEICGSDTSWNMRHFAESEIEKLRKIVGIESALTFMTFQESCKEFGESQTTKNLLQIWEEGARATHTGLSEDEISGMREEIREAVLKSKNLLIAQKNEEWLGFIEVEKNEIAMLFVSPNAFKKGVGKALIKEAFARYLCAFEIIKVNSLEWALDFYQHLGFQRTNAKPISAGNNGTSSPELIPLSISCADLQKSLGCEVRENVAIKRCDWASDKDEAARKLYEDYHDTEWGVPLHEDKKLFEFLVLETMQAGLSWITILKKREAFRAAFDDFDPKMIACYDESKIQELMNNESIIRNRLKIESAIHNAKLFLEIQKEFGSFDKYIWGFVEGKPIINHFASVSEIPTKTSLSDKMSKDLQKRGFKFVGSTIMYAYMQAIGMVNDHLVSCFKRNSPLGMQCDKILDFSQGTDAKSANLTKNPKNSHSHTANTKIVDSQHIESSDTKGQSHLESSADLDSAVSLRDFKSCEGATRGSYLEGNDRSGVANSLKITKETTSKVLCAVSGGVDSSVVAALLYRAIGENLIPVFVDTGLLRKGEREAVEKMFRENLKVPLITADASALFLQRLKGVIDPEKKRKIIGKTFIEVFEKEAKKYNQKGEIKFLAQGTLYPDVIESVSVKGPSKTIKSHHNVGGLPEWMQFELIEPLRELFKDEVRALGRELGMPESMLMRHPFPGPGLAIRIMGEVNKRDLDLLREADSIFIEELHKQGYYDKVWQAFCVLLNVRSVGVMGDNRTYDNAICVRAVEAIDGMTATFAHLPHDFLESVSNRIINEVEGINRVVYDITSKPPGTIEWE